MPTAPGVLLSPSDFQTVPASALRPSTCLTHPIFIPRDLPSSRCASGSPRQAQEPGVRASLPDAALGPAWLQLQLHSRRATGPPTCDHDPNTPGGHKSQPLPPTQQPQPSRRTTLAAGAVRENWSSSLAASAPLQRSCKLTTPPPPPPPPPSSLLPNSTATPRALSTELPSQSPLRHRPSCPDDKEREAAACSERGYP